MTQSGLLLYFVKLDNNSSTASGYEIVSAGNIGVTVESMPSFFGTAVSSSETSSATSSYYIQLLSHSVVYESILVSYCNISSSTSNSSHNSSDTCCVFDVLKILETLSTFNS